MNRRSMLLVTAAAVPLASCALLTPGVDIIKSVTDAIGRVQAGVVAACATFGKWVPTAETVIAILADLIGTALNQETLAKVTADIVAQAITTISTQCPSLPTPPAASRTARGISIVFY